MQRTGGRASFRGGVLRVECTEGATTPGRLATTVRQLGVATREAAPEATGPSWRTEGGLVSLNGLRLIGARDRGATEDSA